MNIFSVDVGTKNLAVCQIDRQTNTIQLWQVEQIDVNKEQGLLAAVFETMERINPQGYDVALIEKQPTNRQMIRVESMIAMYLKAQQRTAEVIVYSPVHKLKDVAGSEATKGRGKRKYAARKKLSIQTVTEWLSNHPQAPGLTQCFHESSKKDDFADALLQALSYTSTNVCSSSNSKRQVHARKPTDKQMRTRAFSMSNLKWLINNSLQQGSVRTMIDCFADPAENTALVQMLHKVDWQDACIAAALRRNRLTAEAALNMLGFGASKE